MSFRWATGKSLFLAMFMLGALPLAQAQPTNPPVSPGQQIVFSTPEGNIASNNAAPVVQAPEPQGTEGLPDEAPVSVFSVHLPQPSFPTPGPTMMPQEGMRDSRDMEDPMDPMGQRKALSIVTPAQIMGARTVQQIFGLPDWSAGNKWKNSASAQNTGNTNIISSDESSSESPSWAKSLADNTDQNTSDTGKTGKSHGLLDGLFNGPPDESLFGNQDKDAMAGGFGPSLADGTASGQSPFGAALAAATPENLSPGSSPAVLNSGQASPFSLPQSSSLGTLPQLPTLPSLPGQSFNPTPAIPPSWQPKPPPWSASEPQPGTMEQRKF